MDIVDITMRVAILDNNLPPVIYIPFTCDDTDLIVNIEEHFKIFEPQHLLMVTSKLDRPIQDTKTTLYYPQIKIVVVNDIPTTAAKIIGDQLSYTTADLDGTEPHTITQSLRTYMGLRPTLITTSAASSETGISVIIDRTQDRRFVRIQPPRTVIPPFGFIADIVSRYSTGIVVCGSPFQFLSQF